ncbi:hypothetical protein HanPSC8_Chr03g0130861 [Helianthus annuus]|nr:hypothetical protein HanPSC8_Chr03g0130861 [Helianthus annuus]
MFQIDIYMQSTSSVSSSPIQRYRFKPQNIIFLNPSFNKQDLDFFYLIIFISSSSLELLGSQMLHSVTFWCVNPSILLTTAIINGSIYVITFCFVCLKFVSEENGTSRTSF